MPNSTMDEEHLLYCPKLDTKQTTAQEHHQTLLGCQSDDEITSPISAPHTPPVLQKKKLKIQISLTT